MRTWIVGVRYRGPSIAGFGKPFGVCAAGETDPGLLEYRAAVKTAITLHGYTLVGWGGAIYRDWPVDGHVYRFFAEGGTEGDRS
jgi:hypothetical protein